MPDLYGDGPYEAEAGEWVCDVCAARYESHAAADNCCQYD